MQQRSWKGATSWLTFHGLLSLLEPKTICPGMAPSHNELGFNTSVINQEKCP